MLVVDCGSKAFPISASIGFGAGGVSGGNHADKDKGQALATLSPGNLSLANQAQDLTSLNTDLPKANTQVQPFDIERLKARQQSAAALSELLNMGVGDLAQELDLAEGSPVKTALHGVVGALVSLTAGGNVGTGALAGAASELVNGLLQQVLAADPSLSDDQKSALTQWVATAVGAAVGGQAGAAAALDNVNYNYLTHEQLQKAQAANRKLVECIQTNQCTNDEMAQAAADVAQYKAISQSNTRDLIATCARDGSSQACQTKIDDLIKLADESSDLFYQPSNNDASPYVFAAGNYLNLDSYLATSLKEARENGTSTQAALEAGLAAYARNEGGAKAVLDAVGVAGVAACSTVSAGTCAVLAIGAAASASHLYGYVQQVITGQEAKSALVQVLVSQGLSLADAETYQSYIDTGVIVVTAGAGGIKFVVNKARAGSAADELASLNGKSFDVDDVLPNAVSDPNSTLGKTIFVDNNGNALLGEWRATKKLTAPENAFAHWTKHSSEFPEYSNPSQYVAGAQSFVSNPSSNVLTKTRTNGDTLFYDPVTNTFAVSAADGAPRTMFRPADGINYWNKQ